MIKVVCLFFGYRVFALQITHVQGTLDVRVDAGARQREQVDHLSRTVEKRAGARIAKSVSDKPLAFRVKTEAALERLEFIFGQVVLGPLP